MKNFPLFINTVGQTITIAGGGEQAAQKARLLKRTEANIRLMAPLLNQELSQLVAEGRAEHVAETVSPAALRARLVIAATGCAGADAAIADLARQHGALANAVDRPAFCDVTMPAIVDRDPVVVAIGTEGTAPVLARQVKSAIEAMLEPELGGLAALAGRIRERVAFRIRPRERRAFWEWLFGSERQNVDLRRTERAVARVLDTGMVPDTGRKTVALIVGEGADLVTLRALNRLQSTDLVIVEDGVPEEIIELARRDAERSHLNWDTLVGTVSEASEEGTAAVLVLATSSSCQRAEAAIVRAGLSAERVPVASTKASNALKLVV